MNIFILFKLSSGLHFQRRNKALHSVYIDYDVSEIINEFKTKAKHKHIELHLSGIPEVETISAH